MLRQKSSKVIVLVILTLVLILGLGTFSVSAATIGQSLTSPEASWQRFDDSDSKITYSKNGTIADSHIYQGNSHYLYPIGSSDVTVNFKFYGTKLRLIAQVSTGYLTNANVQIDSNPIESYTENYPTINYQVLLYEKTGLTLNTHTVKITYPANTNQGYALDAIDIDSTGYITLAPNSPTLSSPTIGDSKVDLSWSAISDATSYSVKRATTAGGTYTTIANNITGTTYSDTSVTNGVTYYYVVSASNSNGESPNSNEVSAIAVPSATVLSGTAENAQNNLSWASVAGATGYNVKRGTATGTYTTIASNITETTYLDTNVTNGNTYYYVVSAVNGGGESGNSNEVVLTPQDPNSFAGNKAILEITMNNGKIKEYDLSMTDIESFLTWYDNRANGTGKAYYAIRKTNNIKPFLSRRDYIIFDKIQDFEIKDYSDNN